MYKPVLLLALLSNVLFAAAPGITLQVSSETAPPGGYAQFKIALTTPALVSGGSVIMNFDPAIFGPATGLAALSATGDQTGSATLAGQQVVATFTSSSFGFGQLPDLPILVVTVPVLATAKIGATASITASSTIGAVNPGTFTVGGSLSIQNVTPGGGLLPSGTVVAIDGTGFDASTTVTIDGVSISSTQLVSAQQINLTLAGSTEMTGKHVDVANAEGATVDYFASLPGVVTSPFAGGNLGILILPSLPSPTYTAVQWLLNAEAPGWYECLQNPNAFPVTTIFYWVIPDGVTTTQTVIIPPYGQYIAPSLNEGIGAYYMTVSAPIRMAQVFDSIGDRFYENQSFQVTPPMQMTSLGELGVGQPGALSRAWSWQVGTQAPAPQTAGTFSAFPLKVSFSGGADAWLNVTTTNGAPTSYQFTMTPVVTGLDVGSYSGTVTLTPQLPPDLAQFAPGSVSIAVTLTVTAQPQLLSDGGSTVPFSMVLGAAPPTQAYPVMTNGNPAAFTASVTPNSGNWLSVTPSSGTAPATLTLAVNPAGLTAGSYQSSFVIQGPINTLNVAVTLTISNSWPWNPGRLPGLAHVFAAAWAGRAHPAAVHRRAYTHATSHGFRQHTVRSRLADRDAGRNGGANVNATAMNLGPGTYQGTVTITSPLNLVATVPVTLIVAFTTRTRTIGRRPRRHHADRAGGHYRDRESQRDLHQRAAVLRDRHLVSSNFEFAVLQLPACVTEQLIASRQDRTIGLSGSTRNLPRIDHHQLERRLRDRPCYAFTRLLRRLLAPGNELHRQLRLRMIPGSISPGELITYVRLRSRQPAREPPTERRSHGENDARRDAGSDQCRPGSDDLHFHRTAKRNRTL